VRFLSPRRHLAASVALAFLTLAPAGLAAGGGVEAPPPVIEDGYPEYLSLADGLHVTGTPIEVDAATYRLAINGKVREPQALSLEQVRALPAVRPLIDLECPGFFTDTGYWTGVPLRDLLDIAGMQNDAKAVEFISIDGSYSQSMSLSEIAERTVLVAYQFDGRDFAVYHGYPCVSWPRACRAPYGSSGWEP